MTSGNAPADHFRRPPVQPALLPQDWQRARSELRDAFATADSDSIVRLGDYGPLPVAVVLRMQLLDTAVHNWDLATTLGQDYHPGDATATIVREFAERIVARSTPSAAFAHPTTSAEPANTWQQALGLLGRAPAGRP